MWICRRGFLYLFTSWKCPGAERRDAAYEGSAREHWGTHLPGKNVATWHGKSQYWGKISKVFGPSKTSQWHIRLTWTDQDNQKRFITWEPCVQVENSHGKDSISYTVRAVRAPVAPTIRWQFVFFSRMKQLSRGIFIFYLIWQSWWRRPCRVSKISTDTIALVWSRPHNGGALIQGGGDHGDHVVIMVIMVIMVMVFQDERMRLLNIQHNRIIC